MHRVSVAMATFNGQDYISEQLNSLSNQIFLPAELVVCDDGSIDFTVDIIKDFAKTAPFPVKIILNENNLGPIDNFFKAAALCSGDWISFCDQDDFWFPNKISSAIEEIERRPNVSLVLQSAYFTNFELESTGIVFPKFGAYGYFESNQLNPFFEWHGFLQTVRSDFFRMFNFESRPINRYRSFAHQSHDQWTCMIANAIGGVSIIGDVVALYRRHPRAVTGTYITHIKKSRFNILKTKPSTDELQWMSQVSESYATYLEEQRRKQSNVEHFDQLEYAIKEYMRLVEIYQLRSHFYSTRSILFCVRYFWKIIRVRGYSRNCRASFGLKGFIRDIFHCFF